MTQLLASAISVAAGAIIAILIDIIPGVNEWFAALDPTKKRGVMAILMLIVAAVVYALSCAGLLAQVDPNLTLTCDSSGLLLLIQSFLLALGANQGTYWVKPK